MPKPAHAPAPPPGTNFAHSSVRKNAITMWPKISHGKQLPKSASGRQSAGTSLWMPCIRCPYQTNPNTKRKTKAAMNAMKNFFQFIIFSVEVTANPQRPWHIYCQMAAPLVDINSSYRVLSTLHQGCRVVSAVLGFNVQPELAQQAYIEIYLRVFCGQKFVAKEN